MAMLTHLPPSPYLLNLSLQPNVVALASHLLLPLPFLRAARSVLDGVIRAAAAAASGTGGSSGEQSIQSKLQIYSRLGAYAATGFYLLHALDTLVSHYTHGASGLRSAFVASSLSTVLVTLALQPVVMNVVSGVLLPLQNRFAVGETICLSQSTSSYIPVTGVVKKMGVLDCVFVKEDGLERVSIGNLEVLQGRVRNLSREHAERMRLGME